MGRHTHPGEEIEISYIIEGQGEILIEGRPPSPSQGRRWFCGSRAARSTTLTTPATAIPLKLSAVYLVEKGKPLATPTP